MDRPKPNESDEKNTNKLWGSLDGPSFNIKKQSRLKEKGGVLWETPKLTPNPDGGKGW